MKDSYRPEQGALKRTFMNRILRNKLADLAKMQKTNKRRVSSMSESLDVMDEEEKKNGRKSKALVMEEDVVETITAEELPEAISRAVANLTFRQKRLCRFLEEGMSIARAGEKMQIPRTTLNDEVKRIREVFRREGLEEYLR